jgi:hypothetical protein
MFKNFFTLYSLFIYFAFSCKQATLRFNTTECADCVASFIHPRECCAAAFIFYQGRSPFFSIGVERPENQFIAWLPALQHLYCLSSPAVHTPIIPVLREREMDIRTLAK